MYASRHFGFCFVLDGDCLVIQENITLKDKRILKKINKKEQIITLAKRLILQRNVLGLVQ